MQHENACSEACPDSKGALPLSFDTGEMSVGGRKRLPGRPKGSCNKYPGKKRFPGRPRGTSAKFAPEIRRKRGPKGKLKPFPPTVGALTGGPGSAENVNTPAVPPLPGTSTGPEHSETSKEKSKEEEPAFENKIVLCSSQDHFVLEQDLCAMCGSLGEGDEGKLIACSQCGQCYHPYCVNIKVTKVIINKGWRCLECTVCEGCGQPHDEARLLLCDECDISYHTYCLETPLDEVPQGTWKCRWCVVCVKCGATTPGYKSLWQKNYTECGPCSSQTTCPVCNKDYSENDLIIQCIQCNRWLHAKCDGMVNEDDCESAADYGYHCSICRPKDEPPPHLQARKLYALAIQQQNSKSIVRREDSNDNSFGLPSDRDSISRRSSLDSSSNKGPLISDVNMGCSVPSTLTITLPRDVSPAYCSPSLTIPSTVLSTGSVSVPTLSAPTTPNVPKLNKYQTQYRMDGVLLSESGMNQIKSLLPEPPKRQRAKRGSKHGATSAGSVSPSRMDDMDEGLKDDETGSVDDAKLVEDGTQKVDTDQSEKKKRQRRMHKLGIGGFSVKQRGRLSKDEDFETSETVPETEANSVLSSEKPKRRRRGKKKSQLQDTFPSYLQEAFFGKLLLDSSKDPGLSGVTSGQGSGMDLLSEDEIPSGSQTEQDKVIKLKTSDLPTPKVVQKPPEMKPFIDEASNGGIDDDFQNSDALRDLLPLTQDLPQDDELVNMLMNEGDDLSKNDDGLDDLPVDEKSSDDVQKADDPIDSVLLSPHFNLETIVADSGLPHMDSKDVEDVFKGVLIPEDGADVNPNFGPLAQISDISVPGSVPSSPVTPKSAPLTPTSFPLHFPIPRPSISAPQDFIPPVQAARPGPEQNSDVSFQVQKPSFPQPLVTPSPSLSPAGEATPQWPTESESETTSQGQKNILKWEGDEALGNMATISPVLYANMNYPNLKNDYPNWSDRVKQISKFWRQLGSEQRQPYLQKARENRAANRVQKAQSDQNKGSGKEGRAVKETEQEKQWKQMQAVRQQQMQQQQQVLLEQKKKGKLVTAELSGGENDSEDAFLVQNSSENAGASQQNRAAPVTFHQNPIKTEVMMQSDLNTQIPSEDSIKNRMRIPLQGNLPLASRLSNTASPGTPMNSLIQVSRVRPPIDPNLIPGSANVSQPAQDPYCNPSTPRPSSAVLQSASITPPKPPFSPSSPLSVSQPLTPVPSDIYQTSPKTPRPHGCDSFSGHLQSAAPPPSPVSFIQQPRTPKPIASPFSPNPSKPNLPVSDAFSPGPLRPSQQQPQQQQAHPPSPMDAYSPLGTSNTGLPDPYSPSPRITQSLSTESFVQAPSTPRSDTSSPYSRPPPTPAPQHQEYIQQTSNSAVESYSHTPAPQRQQQILSPYENNDPYARQVPTPRAMASDPYSRPPGTPHPSTSQQDPYAYQPATPRPHFAHRMPATGQTQHSLLQSQPQMSSSNDPYSQQPLTPMPSRDYNKDNLDMENQGRQQLRDLLQKQHLRRQPDVLPQWCEQQESPRQVLDNPTFPRVPVSVNQIRAVAPVSHGDGFRPPFPPGVRPRMVSPNEHHVFRHPADGRMVALPRIADPRVRAALQQQQQQHWMRLQNSLQQQQPQPQRLPMQQKLPLHNVPIEGQYALPSNQIQGVRTAFPLPAPSPISQASAQPYMTVTSTACMPSQQPRQPIPNTGPNVVPSHPSMNRSSIDDSTPKTVEPDGDKQEREKLHKTQKPNDAAGVNPSTSELVKQVQEQPHPELPELDAVPEDLDDDELLGLGNDFNILEYADPELDKALGIAGGSKNNIFDEHFDDLVEKDDVQEKTSGKPKSHPATSDVEVEQKQKSCNEPEYNNSSIKEESKTPCEESRSGNIVERSSLEEASGLSIPPQKIMGEPKDAPPPYPGNVDDSKFPSPQLPLPPPPPPYEAQQLSEIHLKRIGARQPMTKNDHTPSFPMMDDISKRDIRSTNPSDAFVNQSDALLSDLDFERLKADILSDDSLGVSGGPVMQNSPIRSSPGSITVQPFVTQPSPWLEAVDAYQSQPLQPVRMPVQRHSPVGPPMQPRVGPLTIPVGRMPSPGQPVSPSNMLSPGIYPPRRPPFQVLTIPPPPPPPIDIMTEHDRQQQMQYEQWLIQQQNLLTEQQKHLEADVTKLRKLKKTLNAKQRQQRKNGGQLSETETAELAKLTQEQSALQKTLEKVRKDVRQHMMIFQEYKTKHQKRPNMVGTPQTSIQIPPSPGSSGIPLMSSPRPPPSPMLMGPSGPGTPLPMNNPSTPIPGPGTPQSPAIMSPSPVAPSPSPLMQNSPVASLQHSPASTVTPASPMIQSPIYQQQSSPMSIHLSVSQQESSLRIQNQPPNQMMQEEGTSYQDMYQQKERVVHTHSQLRSPMQSTPSPSFGKPQANYDAVAVSHQAQFQVVHQMRAPVTSTQTHPNLPYHARPPDSPRGVSQHPPRGFGDAFQVQPSNSQPLASPMQMPNQHVFVRRLPPPPYSAYFHQQQQAQQPQLRPFGPHGLPSPQSFSPRGTNNPQGIRMVSNVQGQKMLSGGDVTSFQIANQKAVPATAGLMQHQQSFQFQQHMIRQQQQQQHQHLQQLPSMQQLQHLQHQVQQSPQPYPQQIPISSPAPLPPPPPLPHQQEPDQQHQSYQVQLSTQEQHEHQESQREHLESNVEALSEQAMLSNEGIIQKSLESKGLDKQNHSDVGEAKTSFTLNFEETGSGNENEAVNDAALGGSSATSEKTQERGGTFTGTQVEVKKETHEFASCSHSSSCVERHSLANKEFVLKVENKGDANLTRHEDDRRNSAEHHLQYTERRYSCEESVNPNSYSVAMDASQRDDDKDDFSLNEFGNTKQNVLLKQLLQNCPSADSQSASETSNNDEKCVKEPAPQYNETTVNTVTDAKPAVTPPVEVNLPVSVDIQNSCPPPSMSSAEKKMSYLDIRRAQLEREPTPPPEEVKPKRKRIVKRKDSKTGETGPPTKKRARKASNSKPDEDYEMFLGTLMGQLRALPQMHIVEPTIRPNFNICPVYGSGDLNDPNCALKGYYGHAYLPGVPDYYTSEPFVGKSARKSSSCSATSAPVKPFTPTTGLSRGFYNQEFSRGSFLGSQYYLGQFSSNSFKGHLRDTDSPDSMVSSSSPESYLYEEPERLFKSLSILKEEDPSASNPGRISPAIPVIMPIPTRPVCAPALQDKSLEPERRSSSESDSEKDKENKVENSKNGLRLKMSGIGGALPVPLRESGNVAVTLTLSSADDIKGILSALAKILDIAPPASYDIVERTSTPPSQKLGLYSTKDGKIDDPNINLENILNGKMKFCRFCEIVIMSGAILKKASELPPSVRDDLDEEEVSFCSSSCYMQYAISHRSTPLEHREAGSVVSHLGSSDAKKDSNLTSQVRPSMQIKAPLDILPPMSPLMEEDDISERNSVSLPLSPHPFTFNSEKGLKSRKHSWVDEDNNLSHSVNSPFLPVKQWKSIRYKLWTNDTFRSTIKAEPESDENLTANLTYDVCIKPQNLPEDQRRCALCHERGDGKSDGCARLLNMDVNKWVHLNCALWSSEVYETVNGSLINVDSACKRAMSLCCVRCQKLGASLKCFKMRCTNVYHFPCAIKDKCMFFKDKTLFCPQHVPKVPNTEAELTSFVVHRRVYVNRDEHKQLASMIHQGDQYLMRIGSMIFLNIGQLLPHQLQNFHTPNFIYPVGYKIIRFYWSMRALRKRCKYTCIINDNSGYPEFSVEVEEPNHENVIFKNVSAKSVWQKIITPIVKMRQEAQTIKVFGNYITGEDLFGLSEPAVVRILESLPGVDTLTDYNFRYGRSQFLELPLAINPTGCARTEPKLRTHFKRPHTLHTSNATRSSLQSSISGMEIQSPYIKQFVHSKSSQYRKMKMEWRNNVFLARSRIQGLGLCAARDIEKHTMVIEYIGQLIRNEIAERNERLYETQNRRGVYMFRLDENRVVDATLSGGLARYVNHSCNPNCVAEVVQIDRENKILIIANRKILRGEELTYDYRFEVEDDSHKIQCTCGAPNCRKWMN